MGKTEKKQTSKLIIPTKIANDEGKSTLKKKGKAIGGKFNAKVK